MLEFRSEGLEDLLDLDFWALEELGPCLAGDGGEIYIFCCSR